MLSLHMAVGCSLHMAVGLKGLFGLAVCVYVCVCVHT
jgi:hypothetical protein